MLGTIINAATVGAGSLLGMSLGSRLPEKITNIVFQALGIFTLFIGIKMSLATNNPLILVLSLILGGVMGEWMRIEERLEFLAHKINGKSKNKDHKFSEGLITAFMIFCVGSMTILGCIEEGLSGNRELIITKSIMDFFSSAALASTFGKSILFSIIPLVIYQGGITLGAESLNAVLSSAMRIEMISVGGLMLIGLGITILNLKKIGVVNMLPALLIAPLLTALAEWMEWYAI
jgi:uncharacterized protein